MEAEKLDEELAALTTLSSAQLRSRWSAVTGRPVPKVSPALLRNALGWELQAAFHGGLSRRTQQKLDQLAAAKTETRDAQPGMRLVREWNGTLHVVTIGEDGTIMWNGANWPSLSRVAREITGTRWSGPAFFGLKAKRTAA
ncbi:DUF2924 domain-containing protein [Altererythrobacter buctensis]|uniref:DUF2924 domain-containing protein n=2 Tax=Alteraurantiacibacter buctensis TaxID=1503981 RepID=A0A844Z5D0_9SPHN|nr:DUF2924 domain-containing protein [Alteraurantiacibacter buctensis]